MSTNANAQQWVDRNLYPFRNRMMGFETGKMHCVDEGKRETILFVHGTPTWSFLCRDIVKELPDWYQAQWEQLDKLANKELAYHLGNGRCVCQNGGIISMGRAAAQLRHDRA